MKRIRGWSAVAAVVVFALCLAAPAMSQIGRGPATSFLPTHPIDYPDTPPPVDHTGDPVDGSGGLVKLISDPGLRRLFIRQVLFNNLALRYLPSSPLLPSEVFPAGRSATR